MITYEYQCKNCTTVFTELRSIEDRARNGECPNCSGEGTYFVSAPTLIADIESDRWVKNRESHMKKEQKNMEEHGSYK